MDDVHTDNTKAIILAGGELHTRPLPPRGAVVVAADSGYDHALALGLDVDLLVGDMDSISVQGLTHAEGSGIAIERHPPDKDHTDLELAIRAAIRLGATDIEIHGADDGRIDHLLAVAMGLTEEVDRRATLSWHTATGTVRAASHGRPVAVRGAVGDTVSLIPVGTARGVTTSGMQWTLVSQDLPAGTSRGMSNVLTAPDATVEVESGRVLVVAVGAV